MAKASGVIQGRDDKELFRDILVPLIAVLISYLLADIVFLAVKLLYGPVPENGWVRFNGYLPSRHLWFVGITYILGIATYKTKTWVYSFLTGLLLLTVAWPLGASSGPSEYLVLSSALFSLWFSLVFAALALSTYIVMLIVRKERRLASIPSAKPNPV